ncbi:hypothetical protein BAE44_0006110, partial [Dichanthelium oligosanthes]
MARPPELIDDVIGEILLRLPGDPACLFRASLVCKPWRRLLSDPAFLRRYRAFHDTPPLLGFFRNFQGDGFVATTAAASSFSRPAFDSVSWLTMDCRHGRALLYCFAPDLVVWDPITGDQQRVPPPGHPGYYHAAAVICSEDGQGLSMIDAPDVYKKPEGIVVTAEDNRLGFAGLKDDCLYLWLWQAGADGSVGWTQDRVIKVKTLLPPWTSLDLSGFVEGRDTIIMSTDVGVFAIKLNSMEVRKVDNRRSRPPIIPYMSFYTPVLVSFLSFAHLAILSKKLSMPRFYKQIKLVSRSAQVLVATNWWLNRAACLNRTEPSNSNSARLPGSVGLPRSLPARPSPFPPLSRRSPIPHPNQIIASADRAHAMARPPPDLIDDATTEILLRLPPDDPACLVRASLVCKAWRELVSDAAFLRRYRAFHGAPPLLGFLRNIYDGGPCARFVAAAAASGSPFSAPAFDRPNWWVVECRHGRALLQSFEQPARLVVWDPITGDQRHVQVHVPGYLYFYSTATVLCAADGCGHLDCHGGPFLLVVIGAHDEEDLTWASVYSSETGTWTMSSSIQLDAYIEERPSLLARDTLYFTLQHGQRILKYDFVGQGLQVINAPDMFEQTDGIVVAAEDGGLGFARLKDGNLHLWSWQAGAHCIAEWVQGRVIKLSTLLPIIEPLDPLDVIGFLEGTDTIYISTNVGIFAVMSKSGQVNKVDERGSYYAIAPYTSFYTPGTGPCSYFFLRLQ